MNGQENRQERTAGGGDGLGAGALREAMLALDLELRLAVCLCFDLGLGPDETAAVLDVPVGTATARAREGLRRMHHLLAARGLERLPDEIAAAVGSLPRPPVPERLQRRLEELVAEHGKGRGPQRHAQGAAPLGEGRMS